MRWWEEAMPEVDQAIYASFAYQQPKGLRPCLLVIDVVKSFVQRPEYEEAAGGIRGLNGPADEALANLEKLLAAGRVAGLPLVHSRPSPTQVGVFGLTVKGERAVMGLPANRPGAVDFVPEAMPLPGEAVLEKTKASAFFGTPILSYLHEHKVDSLIVAGCTTSGCVRATVVDGFSYGFPVFVVEEAVFDRAPTSHQVALFEMNAKYADVITLDETLEWVAGVRSDGDRMPEFAPRRGD